MLPLVGIELRSLINLWFHVQHSPIWANWAFACKAETLGSLYTPALLILTKSKNQVVHQQKFQDLLSITCQVSVERRVLDLESKVHDRPGFYSH